MSTAQAQAIPLFRFRVLVTWSAEYSCFMARCLETGSVVTADTVEVAEDMIGELLLDECAFAIEHKNLPNLTNHPAPLEAFEEFVEARRATVSRVLQITIDRNANVEQTLEVEIVRLADAGLLDAAKRRLLLCRSLGDCADAALQPDEYCSDECVALAKAVAKAEGAEAPNAR